MGNPVHIRHAKPADAAAVLRFIEALALYEREPDAVKTDEQTLRSQLAEARPPFECLLAEIGGAPVGFALYFHTYSTWRGRIGLWLEDLFVLPEARGRGAGLALITRVAAIAVERRCARMEWSVLDWNQPSIDFYRALGANAMDEWTTYRLSDDALATLAGRARPAPAP